MSAAYMKLFDIVTQKWRVAEPGVARLVTTRKPVEIKSMLSHSVCTLETNKICVRGPNKYIYYACLFEAAFTLLISM